MFELPCNVQCSPIQLRPRQAFGNAVPVLLVMNKRERRVSGLQTGTLAQHGQYGSLHGHQVTVAVAALCPGRTAKLAATFQPPSRGRANPSSGLSRVHPAPWTREPSSRAIAHLGARRCLLQSQRITANDSSESERSCLLVWSDGMLVTTTMRRFPDASSLLGKAVHPVTDLPVLQSAAGLRRSGTGLARLKPVHQPAAQATVISQPVLSTLQRVPKRTDVPHGRHHRRPAGAGEHTDDGERCGLRDRSLASDANTVNSRRRNAGTTRSPVHAPRCG